MTTLTVTAAAVCAGRAEMSRLVLLTTVKQPGPGVEMNDPSPSALLDWCRAHFPSAIEEYVDPSALGSTDVIEAVKAKVPSVIRQRVRPGTAKARLAELGVEPMRMTPAQFAQFITDEDKKWGKVIRDAGIKLD